MLESLQYPFDSALILRKKKALKRLLLEKAPGTPLKVAILGGSTTHEVKEVWELFLLRAGFQPQFYQSEFNKYYEDAVFGNPELAAFSPDVVYVHTSWVNITTFPGPQHTEAEVQSLLNAEMEKLTAVWKGLESLNCLVIQNNFDLPVNRSLGNLDGSALQGKTHFIGQLNLAIAGAVRAKPQLVLNDIHYLAASIGLGKWFDKGLWHQAKYAVSYDALPLLANNLTHIVQAALGKTKKCLVLDLDNTCWGGVIGDDGINGIKLGNESATGEAFVAFQRYARELNSRGILLAVCSKNDHQNALEGFTHSDAQLKAEDFAVFKANWEPKHQNIEQIARELNISLDSLVFVDDNPAERAIVRAQVPQVSVPEVGTDVLFFPDIIEAEGFFEVLSLSTDDVNRSRFYQENAVRAAEQAQFGSYAAFLNSLEMKADIRPFTPQNIDRVTQLINKTNQFNLTTQRYTAAEVGAMMLDPQCITLAGRLVDKFGDNGLISVVTATINQSEAVISNWLMSCRVLKRGMEQAMFVELVAACRQRGIAVLRGSYRKTAKNSMVENMYAELGFTRTHLDESGNSEWQLDLGAFKAPELYIAINQPQ